MSKKRLLVRGVVMGYGATAAQVFYSFASVPLALSYLSAAEFGMWSLIAMLGGYLMLAEMGMTNAVTRHLFDCKDGKDPGKYGRLFTASAMALGLVAVVVLLLGFLVAWLSAPLFKIPPDLKRSFIWVMLGQSVLMALTMATRMLGAPLYVYHRQDLGQINQSVLFLIYYLVLFYGFDSGWGIYAMLANQAVGLVWVVGFNSVACLRLGFYPRRSDWGLPSREEWSSVWRYSRALFIVQVGGVVLASVPQVAVVRLVGLEAGAVFVVCTRTFGVLRQLVVRPYEVAMPMLCDTYVRGDLKIVTRRWVEISQLVLALSGTVFAVAAANNAAFVTLWTGGKMAWSDSNDWLIAIHFYFHVAASVSFGIIGLDKEFGHLRFVPLLQALATAAIAVPFVKWWGMAGLIVGITLPFLAGMLYFGVRHLASITGTRAGSLVSSAIIRPSLALPIAMLAAWACSGMSGWLPGYYGLIVSAAAGSALALAAMMFFGVSRGVRDEIRSMASRSLRRVVPNRRAEV